MARKKPKGAPKGNQNALKHGFYSRVLSDRDSRQLTSALKVDGLDDEIAILRVRLRRLFIEQPDRVDLQVKTANALTHMVQARHALGAGRHNRMKDAMTRVINELAIPLGLKSFMLGEHRPPAKPPAQPPRTP